MLSTFLFTNAEAWHHAGCWEGISSIPVRPSTDPKSNTGPVAMKLLAMFASVFQLFDTILLPFCFVFFSTFLGDVGGEALNMW